MPYPHSSTQCELVVLSSVSQFRLTPSLELTESLCSLQLIRSWTSRSESQSPSCFERPTLEKVKAHDEAGKNRGNPKSWGNEQADQSSKAAAAGEAASFVAGAESGWSMDSRCVVCCIGGLVGAAARGGSQASRVVVSTVSQRCFYRMAQLGACFSATTRRGGEMFSLRANISAQMDGTGTCWCPGDGRKTV